MKANEPRRPGRQGWLVDAHVHFHSGFDSSQFIEGADANLRAGASQMELPEDTPGCLLLAETSREHYFEIFRSDGLRTADGRWTVCPTNEPESLLLCRDGRPRHVLVAGRQVATRDGLEVLALGCTTMVPDGRPIEETLESALAADAIAVLPWGFGKWWFGRGRIAGRLLEEYGPKGVYLGDNSARPEAAPEPRLFRRAAEAGVLILPGSDPLPFADQVHNAGRYGFLVECAPAFDSPFAQIRQQLRQVAAGPRRFGRRENLRTFLRIQSVIQVHKLWARMPGFHSGS